MISVRERPEAYKPATGVGEDQLKTSRFEHPEAVVAPADALTAASSAGIGDNVVKYPRRI